MADAIQHNFHDWLVLIQLKENTWQRHECQLWPKLLPHPHLLMPTTLLMPRTLADVQEKYLPWVVPCAGPDIGGSRLKLSMPSSEK